MKSARLFWFVVLLAVAAGQVSGQGWQRSFPGLSQPYAILAAPDGGAALLATLQAPGGADRELVVVKTDADGRIQWQKTCGATGDDEGRALIYTAGQQGFVVAGKKSLLVNNGDVWLAALDADGALLWEKTYNFGVLDDPCCLRATADGGYVVALEADNQLRLLKTDAGGEENWSLAYPQTAGQTVQHLEMMSDGGFLVTLLRSNPPIAAPIAGVLRTDASGNVLYYREFQHFTSYATTDAARAKPIANDACWLMHRDSLYRLDAAGQRTAGWRIAAAQNFYLTDFLPAPDGGLWALGTEYSYDPPPASSRIWLGRLDVAGNVVWSQQITAPSYAHSTWALAQQADGGFFLSGNLTQGGAYTSYLLRTDSLGRIFSNTIEGRVFWDQNADCTAAPDELPLAGWVVKITHPNGEIHYASTDSLGQYAAPAGLGAYMVSAALPGSLWTSACVQQADLFFDESFSTQQAYFPIGHTADCPLPWVDAGVAEWLPCLDNAVEVRYANRGTAPAPGAAVALTLDSLLVVSGASVPYVQTGLREWTFPLGELAALRSGAFTVQVVPACSGLVPGQARCLRVDITPDSPCPTPAEGPLIVVEGTCDADSVRFRVRNEGDAMTLPLNFIVIEDDIMFKTGEFQLGNGGVKIESFEADGATWRFEARQADGVPASQSDPVVASVVEACIANGGSFSTGFVNQYSLFDGGVFQETECREVVDAPGGLAKIAYPSGYDTEHFISANTALEYVLHAVNHTGDTIAAVVLRDTLDAASLDPASVEPGPSSHPYRFQLSHQGVLAFRFDSLFWPPEARLWVKFRVAQRPDLPFGTVIVNRAAAGFDYEAPVPTNATFHTLAGSPLSIQNGAEAPPAAGECRPVVWPVPSQEQVFVELPETGHYRVELCDGLGQVCQTRVFAGKRLTLSLKNLPAGVYVVRFWSAGRFAGAARLVKTE